MPNRILKESICYSDSIDGLSWFEEVLFYRLIVNCDDYGRFDGRPAVIKSRLFPLRDNVTVKAVEAAMNKLVNAELVVLYVFEGKPYLHLPTWDKHQQVRAKRSKYPSPDEICNHLISDDIKCNHVIADVPVIQSESLSESEPLSESLSESEPACAEPAEFSGELGSAFADWIAYKRERRETYKETGYRNLVTQVRNAANTYGDAAVVEVIRNSIASNYRGIIFDRLKKNNPQGGKSRYDWMDEVVLE